MKLLSRILAVTAGVGAVAGAAALVRKKLSIDIDIKPESETPEEEAELDAFEAEAEARTERELKETEGNAIGTAFALARGWLRRHIFVKVEPAEEAEHTGDPAPSAQEEAGSGTETPAPADDAPNPNPVEAAPSAVPVDENGRLDATKLASPEDFADWDEQGCKG